jgi:hypothetical protein
MRIIKILLLFILVINLSLSAQERGQVLLGKPYYLFTDCGGGHEWASKPMVDQREIITDFLFNDVIKGKKRQIHLIEKIGNRECQDYSAVDFCE